MSEIPDRDITDWLSNALGTQVIARLVHDASFTPDLAVTALMLELRDQPVLRDPERFEVGIRAIVTRWWPEFERRAAAIRALVAADLQRQGSAGGALNELG